MPLVLPSGSKLFMNTIESPRPRIRTFDLNLVAGAFLDQQSPFEHGATSRLSNGDDTHNAIQFSNGPSGTDVGSIVQWNYNGTPNFANRITGRIIVGPNTGYPYPPAGEHISGISFNRTGLLGVSIVGDLRNLTLLNGELLYVDSDPQTNPDNFVCRVGHHRTADDSYFAEPHVTISPSGTRMLFGSSWGTRTIGLEINSYVVELPGYKP